MRHFQPPLYISQATTTGLPLTIRSECGGGSVGMRGSVGEGGMEERSDGGRNVLGVEGKERVLVSEQGLAERGSVGEGGSNQEMCRW